MQPVPPPGSTMRHIPGADRTDLSEQLLLGLAAAAASPPFAGKQRSMSPDICVRCSSLSITDEPTSVHVARESQQAEGMLEHSILAADSSGKQSMIPSNRLGIESVAATHSAANTTT